VGVVFLVLVGLGVSGSSTGMFWSIFGEGTDHNLIAGEPRAIRTDEWFVQSSWVVSQYASDFAVDNGSFPGGADSTIQNDAPSWDWSTLFRPHVAGFLFLPLDQGMAVRWWLPGLALIAAAYVFVVSVLPRRPGTAALVAVGAYFSPILQWWYLPTTLYPVAWAFLGLSALIWLMKATGRQRIVAVVLSGLTGYLTIAMVMSIYVPFIIPAAVVLAVFGLSVLVVMTYRERSVIRAIRSLSPLLLALVASVVVLAVWVFTRLDTIRAVLATVYPGTRLTETGAVDAAGVISLLGGPFNSALMEDYTGSLGPNQSEASSVIPFALLLLIPAIAIIASQWRERRRVEWPLLAAVGASGIALAYWFLPGWDFVAHFIALDRTQTSRMRLILVILGAVLFVLIARHLERHRLPSAIAWSTIVVTVVYLVALLFFFSVTDSELVRRADNWRWIFICIVGTVALLLFRRITAGAVAFALAGVLVAGGVDPLYRGVFDLPTDTQIGQAVVQEDDTEPGGWVAMADGPSSRIASNLGSAVLFQTGVESFTGVQTYPSERMWTEIDPAGRYEGAWNRLAQIYWTPGNGDPVVTSTFPDRIEVTFDACSDFAQRNVAHVLSEMPLDSPCVTLDRTVKQGSATFYMWDVSSKP
jgi:cytochrome bd-type quinol oxidase subunit 2